MSKSAFLIGVFLLNFGLSARAEEVVNSSTDSSRTKSILSDVKFSYAAWLKGATLENVDGNADGKGTNLSVRNYQDLSYSFTPDWRAEVAGEFRQYFRPADPKKKDRKDFEWRDPEVGVNRKNVWANDNMNLAARLRYRMPISDYNRANQNKEWDEGKGSLRTKVTLGGTFNDGLIITSLPLDYVVRFANQTHKVRQDYYLKARPSFGYRLHKTVVAKLEYETGEINHKTNGTWTKFNDADLGQTVNVLADWTPIADLLVTPQIAWGKDSFRLNKAELSLYAKYAFL